MHSALRESGAPAWAVAVSAWTSLGGEWECAPSPGLPGGRAWTFAALMRSVPGARSAAAMAVATSACLPLSKSTMSPLCHSTVPAGAQSSVMLTRSAPEDRDAPAPAVAVSAWTCPEGGRESAPSPGAVGRAWTCAALTRSVPRARSAAAMAAATSACGYITVLHDGRTAVLWQEGAFIRGHGAVTAWRWPVPFSPSPAIKRVHAISSCL